MSQNITLMGASYSAVPKVRLPKTGGGTADFTDVSDTTAAADDVAQGKYFYAADGTRTQGTNAGGGGGLQGVGDFRTGSCAKTSLTDVGLSVTAPATGEYTIFWHCWRTNTSGTWGSRYYKGGTAQGSENTTWTNNYIQTNRVTKVSLNAGDVITVRARSRSTSYTIYVGDLVLIQTA